MSLEKDNLKQILELADKVLNTPYKLEKIQKVKKMFGIEFESNNIAILCHPDNAKVISEYIGDVVNVIGNDMVNIGRFVCMDSSLINLKQTPQMPNPTPEESNKMVSDFFDKYFKENIFKS